MTPSCLQPRPANLSTPHFESGVAVRIELIFVGLGAVLVCIMGAKDTYPLLSPVSILHTAKWNNKLTCSHAILFITLKAKKILQDP